MSNILPFRPKKKIDRSTGISSGLSKGNTLCRNNHHKWKVVKEQQFDVKAGKLVTVEQCERCKKRRNRLT